MEKNKQKVETPEQVLCDAWVAEYALLLIIEVGQVIVSLNKIARALRSAILA